MNGARASIATRTARNCAFRSVVLPRDDEPRAQSQSSIIWNCRRKRADGRRLTAHASSALDSMTAMLSAKDPPYADAVVTNARVAATKLEKMLFEKCKSEESYKRKVLNKIESISEKIIRDRAQKNMEAQGLKMAEAPAKRAKTEGVGGGEAASTSTARSPYEEGRAYFEALSPVDQKTMRRDILKRWLEENKGKTAIANEFQSTEDAQVRRQIYVNKLKDHLDLHMFKSLTNQLRAQRPTIINPELQGFVADLVATDAMAMQAETKRQAIAAATKSSTVQPTSEYWLKVHELHEKYHATLSRALKNIQSLTKSGEKLSAIRQKFVDLLSKVILPAIEQTPNNRNLNVEATVTHLEEIERSIKKALSSYDVHAQRMQDQKRLLTMAPTQRAIVSLTEGVENKNRTAARAAIAETCSKLNIDFDDFTADLFDSDEEEDEAIDVNELLKDVFASAGDQALEIVPAGAPETWTLELGKDVVAVGFRGDAMSETERIATVAEY